MGTQVKLRTNYHPQTDGQSEQVNQCIEMYIRCMTRHKPTKWRRWIPLAGWWYNTTFHTAIEMSPYKALHGINPAILNYHQEGKFVNPEIAAI